MDEINKEKLRESALATIKACENLPPAFGDHEAWQRLFRKFESSFRKLASPSAILFLLDENAAQAARIAELERECERLRKEVDKRIDQGRNSHEMLNNVLRENAELREAHDKEWRRSETNAQNVIAMAAELEACRKDAAYWRYMRDSCQPLDSDVFSAINEWLWGSGDIAEVAFTIDAAMQEETKP